MKTEGDLLLEIIGTSTSNPLAIEILNRWGLVPKETKNGIMFAGEDQYGQLYEDKINEPCSILLKVGGKKIQEFYIWSTEKKSREKSPSLFMPYSIQRATSPSKLIKILEDNNLIVNTSKTKDEINIQAYLMIKEEFIGISFTYELKKSSNFINNYTIFRANKQYSKEAYFLLNPKQKTQKKKKREKGKLGDIKYYIDVSMDYDINNKWFATVTNSCSDEEIVDAFATLLNLKNLKAELRNVSYDVHPFGYEMYIHYNNNITKIDHDENMSNGTTVNTLNFILKDTHQLRLVVDSLGADFLDFLPLLKTEWEELEKEFGKERVEEYFEYTDELFV